MDEVKVRFEVEVNPTENLGKVRETTRKVFGEFELKVKEKEGKKWFFGRASGIEALLEFKELLHRERILNAARKMFFRGVQGKKILFFLNKQVAYVGHLSFSQQTGESVLGPILIEIECDDPLNLIEWLVPKKN
jgi:predicted RNA binding protein with dsRBD fold (UPF0201 family)